MKSDPVTIYRSVGNPNLTTANLLAAFLKQAGISLNGKIKLESTRLLETDKLLTQIQSDPLIHSLQDMLFYSNNYIADTLMLDLWRETQLKSPTSIQLSQATQLLFENYKPMLANTHFSSQYADGLPIFKNASGLTPLN